MEKILRFLKGWVRLRLLGGEPERFLNICGGRRIPLWDLRRRNGTWECSLFLKDFFGLRPAVRKSGTRVKLLDRRGLPFFLKKCRKRMAFITGFLLCLFLLLLLSRFIWNIHVEGNYTHTTGEILAFLESGGIRHGMQKNQVDCAGIAASIRRAFPDVTWVSARIQGTRLLVELRENMEREPAVSDSLPAEAVDLAASREGVVESIITRRGIPLAEAGDTCKAGDILVSGLVPLKDDSGEILRWESVEADADIVIRWTLYYYDEFSRNYTIHTYQQEERSSFYLDIFGWRLDFTGARRENCDYLSKEQQLFLTENFAIPLRFGTLTARPYTETEAFYSREEAADLAEERLHAYTENLEKTGVEILENHVKITISDTKCKSSGTLTVRSLSAKKVPSAIQDPEENAGKEDTE